MKRTILLGGLYLLLCLSCTPVRSLQLADIFGEGMVLQQRELNTCWGQASPSAVVTVEIQDRKSEARADANGSWRVSLAGLKPGGPFELKVKSGSETFVLKEVYVGEVWLAAGQSNMERRLSMSEHGEQAVAQAKNPNIRFLMVPKNYYEGHLENNEMKWQTAVAPQVGDMSAIGYYFAKDLQETLDVPIGIICLYKGGVPAEAFVSEETLMSDSVLRPILDRYRETAIHDDKRYEEEMEEYKQRFKHYNDSVAMGHRDIARPFEPIGPKHHKRPLGLYHSMLKRILPYPIRGVIWYQGEGNAERGEQYKTLFPALIKEWRRDFEQPELPFYFVQLPGFDHPFWQERPNWAELRDAQLYTWKTVANTAMVVSIDKGDKNDLHPIYKEPIGRRLAGCALALIYGKDVPYTGPIYSEFNIQGNKIEVSFDFVYSGLDSKGESLSGFSICGADGMFVPAEAEINGNKVIVWSDCVKAPVAVRYGWANWTEANLFNREGLPASPFRTDDFPMLSKGIYYPVKIR